MSANILTVLRILLVAPLLFFIHLENFEFSFVLFIVAAFTDFLDGFVARTFKQVTILGKFLDPLADKILVISILLMFIEKKYVNSFPIILILIREFTSLTFGAKVIAKNGTILVGKIKNLFQFMSIAIILYFKQSHISTITIWIASIITFLSLLIMLIQNFEIVLGTNDDC